MIGLLRSELRKVTSTRMVLGLTLALVGYTALNAAALVFFSGQQGAPPLTEPSVARAVYASAGAGSVIVLVLGILGMTTEYRHMTITSTLLATPRRGRVMVAKSAVFAVVGVIEGVIACVVGIGLAALLLPLKDHAPVDGSTIAAIAGGTLLAFAIYGILGISVGALIRNQIAAIIAALVWVLLVEALVVALLPNVGKWLPGGAVSAILQTTSFSGTQYLPVWGGALLLAAYAVVLGAIAAATTMRRDIT